MSDYEKALALATAMHAGQKRKNGEDYINHCVRVADKFIDIDGLKTIAVLHDILEDTDIEYAVVQNIFGSRIASTVGILTRIHGQSYLDYILLVKTNKDATAVKLADLEDNLNGATGTLRDKYLMAKWILSN